MFAELQTDAVLGGLCPPQRDATQLRARAEAILRADAAAPSLRPRSTRWIRRSVMAVAASACAALAVFVVSREHRHANADRVYTTGIGQQATLSLADGSRVHLAPQSTLRVPTDFGRTMRAVHLDGEAYFDVDHAARTPFLVRAGQSAIRVLGTVFDVRHYATDRVTHVHVVNGRVSVTDRAGHTVPVVVVAGDGALVSDSTGTVAVTRNADGEFEWRDGRLQFHMTPVSDVLTVVSRWYGYQFRLADTTLAIRHITTSIDVSRPSADVLGVLQLILDVDMTVDGHVITVLPRRRVAAPNDTRRTMQDSFFFRPEVGR